MRSPKSWVTSLMYGVSPQPAQAPENSKSGCSIWLFFTLDGLHRRAVDLGDREEEVPVLLLALEDGLDGHHVDGASGTVALVAGGAGLDAQAAAGAVLGGSPAG
jgi:hypothetical protein